MKKINKAVLRRLLALLPQVNPRLRCLIRHSKGSATKWLPHLVHEFMVAIDTNMAPAQLGASLSRTIFITLLLLFNAGLTIAAEEKIPIKISPLEPISTAYDETEVGDNIPFLVVEDVYKNGKLFIKKGVTMYGTVDFVKENGCLADHAEIEFKTFRVRNAQGKLSTFNSELLLTGLNTLKWYNPRWKRVINYCTMIFRGNEVDINPNNSEPVFNIWYK